jgi:TPR repeat protein
VNRFLLTLLLFWLASPLASGGQTTEGERRQFEEVKARADGGEAQAQLDLGMLYASGTWVGKDLKRAAKWHRKAAEQGLPRAQYQLGLDYAAGEGVKTDTATAVAWFRRAAEQDLAEAQFSLGLCYANGRGVNPNAVEAVSWFRKAAARGYADAEAELGNSYLQGTGVTKDALEGARWIRRAAERGSASAQNSLALCYEKGTGMAKDYVQAYKWYALAAAQDDEHAADIRVSMAKLESSLTPDQITEAQRLAREFKPGTAGASRPPGGSDGKTGKTPGASETAKTGSVNVTSEDDHCDVFIDGAFVGNSPAKLNLAEGRHLVEVRKPGFKVYRKELQVGAGSELSLRAVLDRE